MTLECKECIYCTTEMGTNSLLYPHQDSKVHGANMRPTWGLLAPDGPNVGPMNLATRVVKAYTKLKSKSCCNKINSSRIRLHWGRVTHIYVSKLTITVSDNGLSPDRHQAIIWSNAGILLIGPLGITMNFQLKFIYYPLENVIWKMEAIMSRPQYVNSLAKKSSSITSMSFAKLFFKVHVPIIIMPCEKCWCDWASEKLPRDKT